ncbi:CPBP family intramembrane glutamic endopeptidase [Paenibacillus illinoisensis]|uniref:CPBP family intramembrane glutamic endopeptidase n=1 Tax=Paenibacillus illinoisensis TaxID=59845 RepID=UPI0015E8BB24
MRILTSVLITIPTVIIGLILYSHKRWVSTEEIREISKLHFWDQVFYATAATFIGFNLINSLTIKLSGIESASSTFEFQLPIIYIYSIIFSPLVEELICRKFLFKKLDSAIGFFPAALLSSILFSVPHFDLQLTLGYIFIGMVWCFYYKRSNNILVPIVSHACFNYITILILSLKG